MRGPLGRLAGGPVRSRRRVASGSSIRSGWRAPIRLVILIVVAGCAGAPSTGASPTTFSPTPAVPSEVTTTGPTTLTTVAHGPLEIPERAFVWEPGTYTTNRFLVPLSFTVEVEGWRSSGAEDDWVMLAYVQPGATDRVATIVVLAYRPDNSVEAVLDAITSIDGVSAMSDPNSTVIGGFDALVVDVEGAPGTSRTGDCLLVASVRFSLDSPGYVLLTEGINGFGIPACYRTRVWVVGVDGTTVTMIATTEDAEDFERLMAAAEQLLDGLQFQAGG